MPPASSRDRGRAFRSASREGNSGVVCREYLALAYRISPKISRAAGAEVDVCKHRKTRFRCDWAPGPRGVEKGVPVERNVGVLPSRRRSIRQKDILDIPDNPAVYWIGT